MALKGDRHELMTDISFFCNDVTDRGVVVVYKGTGGSGIALDDSLALVTVAAVPSGNFPVGMLMNTFVNIDQTRQHINFQKDEMIIGGKACVMRRGWAVTNMIVAGAVPGAGKIAYLTASGLLTNTITNAQATPAVGEFMSVKDPDGYVKVAINLPMATVQP